MKRMLGWEWSEEVLHEESERFQSEVRPKIASTSATRLPLLLSLPFHLVLLDLSPEVRGDRSRSPIPRSVGVLSSSKEDVRVLLHLVLSFLPSLSLRLSHLAGSSHSPSAAAVDVARRPADPIPIQETPPAL